MTVLEVPGAMTARMQFRGLPVPPAPVGALGDPGSVVVLVRSPAGDTTYTYGTSPDLVRDGTGDYHLDVAVLVAGHWLIRWTGSGSGPNVTAEAEFWASDSMTGGPVASPAQAVSWRPSVQDVANLVPLRTADPAGIPQGTFTAATLPTDAQVEGLIAQVMGEVLQAVGDIPTRLATPSLPTGSPGESPAGHCVALGAASLVELTFYPDMQLGSSSPSESLYRRYLANLATLKKAVEDDAAGVEVGVALSPSWSFPDTVARGLATTHWEGF